MSPRGTSSGIQAITQLTAFQSARGPINDGVVFTHSGAFAPLFTAIEMMNYDVHTLINYEGPYLNRNTFVTNKNLEKVINVWGTARAWDGDLGPPTEMFENAHFQGVKNINIEIKGAFHNDFAYNASTWVNDPQRDFVNIQTNLFMRSLYAAAVSDQITSGDLESFLRNSSGVSFNTPRGVWEVNPSLLTF